MKRLGCRLKTFIFLSSFFLCVTTESNIMFMKQKTYPQGLDLCQMFWFFFRYGMWQTYTWLEKLNSRFIKVLISTCADNMCLFCHCQILCFAFHSSQKFKNLTHPFYFCKTYNQTNKKTHIEANFEAFFKTNRFNFLLIVFFC